MPKSCYFVGKLADFSAADVLSEWKLCKKPYVENIRKLINCYKETVYRGFNWMNLNYFKIFVYFLISEIAFALIIYRSCTHFGLQEKVTLQIHS